MLTPRPQCLKTEKKRRRSSLDEVEHDGELEISANSSAPLNWTHPLSVNSLEPTEVTVSWLESKLREEVYLEEVKQSMESSETINEKERLVKQPKQNIKLFPLQTGDVYAIGQEVSEAQFLLVRGYVFMFYPYRHKIILAQAGNAKTGAGVSFDSASAKSLLEPDQSQDQWVSCR